MADRKRKNVENLIKRIEQAKYNQVPETLLEGRSLLTEESNADDSKSLLWDTGFMSLLSKALERDYLKVKDDWLTASKISDFLINCCESNESASKSSSYGNSFLPQTCQNMWALLYNIHQIYLQSKGLKRLEVSFRNVSVNIYVLCKDNKKLAKIGFESTKISQMLESEITVLDYTLIELFLRLSRIDKTIVNTIPTDKRNRLFLSLLNKFVVTKESKLASLCLKCILFWLDTSLTLVNVVTEREIDVDEAFDKWKGGNFDSDLNKLANYIERTNFIHDEQMNVENATVVIQAAWKSYKTRRELAKMNAGFVHLQQLFRLKKTTKEQMRKFNQLENEKQFERKRKNLKENVKFLEKQFWTIKNIHSNQVDKYMEERADLAAKQIQSAWRGYKTRKQLNTRKQENMINNAAKTIQNSIRQYVEKRKLMKYRLNELPGLTEERREELQRKIDRWNEENKRSNYPDRISLEDLHNTVQQKLADHYSRRLHELNSYQKRESLLARLQLDSELLESAPKLNDVTEKDIILFNSKNGAVALTALYAHRHATQTQKMPKWKQTLNEMYSTE